MMYIHTHMVKCTPEKGWWKPLSNAKLSYTLEYSPELLSSGGHKTLARWARKGICDRPTGEQAAYFRMHMWNVGADYIAMSDGASATFLYYNGAKFKRIRKEPFETFKAKALLISAAQGMDGNGAQVIVQDLCRDEKVHIEFNRSRRAMGTVRLQRTGWGFNVNEFANQFVNEIGRPLSERQLAAFIENLSRPLTLNVEISDDYKRDVKGKFVSHETITRIRR